jgi:hypothetical protein
MPLPFQKLIFTLYEQRRVRNWFYTLAFAVFVPTGLRFAILAWKFGDWFDKPLSIFAGLIIGSTAVVTLLRLWTVPPRQTLAVAAGVAISEPAAPSLNASEIHEAAKWQAAHNREIARGAAALGPSSRWPLGH